LRHTSAKRLSQQIHKLEEELPPAQRYARESEVRNQRSAATNNPLVCVMRADPKPVDGIALDVSERSVTRIANSNRPNFSDFLEVKRW